MYAYLMCDVTSKAEICLKKALSSIELKVEVTGIMGKRTRYQQNFIPQLIAKVSLILNSLRSRFNACWIIQRNIDYKRM